MQTKLANLWPLVGLNLRRDWLRICLWLLGLAGLMGAAAAKFNTLYGSQKALAAIIATLKTPAMVAFFGEFTARPPYSPALVYATEMMVFMGLFQAMMSLSLAIHATRSQEDAGTTELLLAHAVGRRSPLMAAICELILANLAAGVLEALGLSVSGMHGTTVSGNWLFGLGLAAFGLMFGAFSLLWAQLAGSGRSATIMSYVWLGALFIARMITDVKKPSLTKFTIFGWIEKLAIYTKDNWAPTLAMLILALLLLVLAFELAKRRDIGAGLLPQRAGRNQASKILAGPFTLLARLERSSTIIWLIGMLILGASYGSIFGNISDLMQTNPTVAKIMGGAAVKVANRQAVLEAAGKLTIIFVVAASVPALITLLKLNGDEQSGNLELLHAKALSRLRLFAAYVLQAVLTSSCAFAAAILGMGLAGAQTMKTALPLSRFMRGFAAYWPALLVVLGITALLAAVLPKLQGIAWILPIYGLISLYLGPMLNFPKWSLNLTPYGWVNDVPLQAIRWGSAGWMLALAAALFVLAYGCYRRRDLLVN